MTEANPSTFSGAVHLLAEDERRRSDAHPDPDALLAYHAGELSAEERERLQDHLAVCPRCARTVLDLASFPAIEPEDPARALSDSEVAGARRHLRFPPYRGPPPRRRLPGGSPRPLLLDRLAPRRAPPPRSHRHRAGHPRHRLRDPHPGPRDELPPAG